MAISQRVLAVTLALALGVSAGMAMAGDINKSTHLGNSGNTKVNTVKAKQYMQNEGDGDGYSDNSDTIVHFGNSKKGDCNMNVGASPGGRNDKEVVVTAKNIINICK